MANYQVTIGMLLNDEQEKFIRTLSDRLECHSADIIVHIIENGYKDKFLRARKGSKVFQDITDSFSKEYSGL